MERIMMEAPLPFRLLQAEGESAGATPEGESDPVDAVIFVGFSLVLGIASRHLLRGTRVPYTVAVLIIGVVLGSIEYGTRHTLGKLGNGIRLWARINPELLLAVFLPALLFESAFSMEVQQIKKCMGQMVLLAGPGVLLSTFCLGSLLKLTFPYNWDWKLSLLLGGLLSATDPVAVVALLKDLGASKKLSTIIEGESLMNDGTAIVVFQLFSRMVMGHKYGWGAIIQFLAQVSLGAVAMGIAFGIGSVIWLGFIFNDTVIEISLTLAVSYVAYYTAQVGAEVSGVLAVMSLGMFYSALARTAFKGESQQSLHHFWEMVAYIANTLIFILSGVEVAHGVLGSDSAFTHGDSWGMLFLLYLFVQLSRAIVIGILYPLLRYFGYGMEWREAIILMWSGLRGAVALSLSLSVKQTSEKSEKISKAVGTQFVFFTGGIVFLTLIVNGSTTQFILQFLGLANLSPTKKRILDYTKYEMLNKALEAFEDLGDDEELGPADWPTVKRYIRSLDNLEEEERTHPHSASSNDNIDLTNLKDIRIRLLNGVQAAYWGMLDGGRITQNTANILMRSVDEAIDVASHEPLSDWKALKSHVHFPTYYRFLQTSICPRKLVTFFTVERLESACYICASFLRAHRIARQQLHDFIGGSDIASVVIEESEVEGEEARKFLEDVRATFPQSSVTLPRFVVVDLAVYPSIITMRRHMLAAKAEHVMVLRVVKTRQVTYAVLNHLIEYVQNLEKVGLLEEKEMLHLHDAVQTDLKKLLRNPPLVKLPKISDMISVHPLLGALPSAFRDSLKGSTRETMKMRGVSLYKEGSKPTGIWLISNGIVKWSSKNIKNKHSLNPRFTHGSTLGLYEVMVGKPYICDMVADSVVLCFYIEGDKVLSELRSDPAIENFLWQESTIVLAKLLLPHIFEKVPMHELRALVAESSTMTIYVRGESIEVPHNCIGFLLEGFIKKIGPQEELITSPAPLVPAYGKQSFHGAEGSGVMSASFSHQGLWYHAETGARVIIFDIPAFEAERSLMRRPSFLSPRAVDHPLLRSHSKEHKGLMSWPEHFFKAKQVPQNSNAEDQRGANSYSEKAMQLSIFGSMVDMKFRSRSFTGAHVRPSRSVSYTRVPSYSGQPLVSTKSEGPYTMRKRLEGKKFSGKLPPATRPSYDAKAEESSDESGPEDEVIVRIDSPSKLSFRQGS